MATNGNGTNGLSKKREETCARIIKAIGESNGLLTIAAGRAGVGLTTIKRYVAEFPSVHQAALTAKEHMLDFAEAKLYQKIKNGDNACLIFYLKCQAKDRGYVERQEMTGAGGGPVYMEIDVKDKLLSILNRLAARSNPTGGDQ